MKIKVGKKYRTAVGAVVDIVSETSGINGYPFLGELVGQPSTRSYSASGEWNTYTPSGWDIVSEVVEATTTPEQNDKLPFPVEKVLRFAKGGDLEWVADILKKNPNAKFSLLSDDGKKVIRSDLFDQFDWSCGSKNYKEYKDPVKVYSQVLFYSYTTSLTDDYQTITFVRKTALQVEAAIKEFLSRNLDIKEHKFLPMQETEV